MTNWKTHFANQKDFIPYAREAGYEGIIMTSWSTSGVYGFTWDIGFEVVDMVQLRNTYPMTGFQILIASYAEALKSKYKIDPKEFVINYSEKQFGLEEVDGEIMWNYFSRPLELIQNGKPTISESIEQMQEEFNLIREQLKTIKPKRNEKEFAHFDLMADLRKHYLEFKLVESNYNSPEFSTDEVPELINKLEQILMDAEELNKRFSSLNEGFLYDSEIKEQNEIRVQPVRVLYNRLIKLR